VQGTWKKDSTSNDTRRGQPYEFHNEKTGWIERYDRNGKLLHYLKPNERKNDVQYYQDAMRKEPTTWFKNAQGEWIASVPLKV